MQLLEAALESFPQCVIQLYYLIQVGFGDENETLVIASSILSIWNIATKMISEDKPYFKAKYQSLELQWKPFHINTHYRDRVLMRLVDFICRLLLILLTWLILGGLVVFIYLGFELFVLFIIAAKTEQLSLCLCKDIVVVFVFVCCTWKNNLKFIPPRLSCLIWIAQTPLKTIEVAFPCEMCNGCVDNICLWFWCCGGFCGDIYINNRNDANFGHWCVMMYRILVSFGLLFANLIHVDNDSYYFYILLFSAIFSLATSCNLSWMSTTWLRNDVDVTMERNAENLVLLNGIIGYRLKTGACHQTLDFWTLSPLILGLGPI